MGENPPPGPPGGKGGPPPPPRPRLPRPPAIMIRPGPPVILSILWLRKKQHETVFSRKKMNVAVSEDFTSAKNQKYAEMQCAVARETENQREQVLASL